MNMLSNFHTHTCRCKHADGHVEDFCNAALAHGLEVLGMTDHAPYPGDDLWSTVRMDYAELPLYLEEIDQCREQFAGRLQVLKGLEIENHPDYVSYIRDTLLGEWHLDYVILAMHAYAANGQLFSSWDIQDEKALCSFTDHTIRAMESGLYAFVAHPDLFGARFRSWNATADDCSRAICQAAVALGMPMEINGQGIRKPQVVDNGVLRYQYPVPRFWEIAAEEGVVALVNTDAHRPEELSLKTELGFQLAEQVGIRVVNETFRTLFGADAVYPVVPGERMKTICYGKGE